MPEGLKYDDGKLRMDLVPMDSLRELAAVYTFGARKYADENWRQGISWKRIYGALLRHISMWFLGQDVDEESGLPHLAHAAWACFTLLNYSHTHREFDDRPVAKQAVAGESVPDASGNSHSFEDAAARPAKSPINSGLSSRTDQMVRPQSPSAANWSR